jgi:hypothetical protein
MDMRRLTAARATHRLKDLTAQEERDLAEKSEATLNVRATVQDVRDAVEYIARVAGRGLVGRENQARIAEAFRRIARKAHRAKVGLAELGPLLDRILTLEEESNRPREAHVVVCPACTGLRVIVERKPCLMTVGCWKCGGRGKIAVRIRNPRREVLQRPPSGPPSLEDLLAVARGLSGAQRRFLRTLRSWRAHLVYGVSTQILREKWSRNPSTNAAFSRMIRKLEARNLILRANWPRRRRKGTPRLRREEPRAKRTTHILLTPLGRAVAGLLPGEG